MLVPYLPPCFTRKFNTDRYLDFSSHHPLAHKGAVTQTLLTRADRICTFQHDRDAEKDFNFLFHLSF